MQGFEGALEKGQESDKLKYEEQIASEKPNTKITSRWRPDNGTECGFNTTAALARMTW